MPPLSRIFLSPPHLGEREIQYVQEAFTGNWIAPVGPNVDAFESEVSTLLRVPHAVALSSGTAALHLALRVLDIGPGDEVWCSTLTFCASANPIVYQGARPVFLDCDATSYTLDPALLATALDAAATAGRLPRALIVVDLYGQCADYHAILAACDRYGVPVIEDAAEALGASYAGRPAGGFGRLGVISFNGNKIITTSGGGMLLSHDQRLIDRARHLATQARDPAPHYQHSQLGYNYRLSNVLAGIGRGQLTVLAERVASRRRIYERYRDLLGDLPGLTCMPEARFGPAAAVSTRWLTVVQIEPTAFGANREQVRLALEAANIEARPVWKPLHLQPLYAGCGIHGGAVSEALFATGLCLPSGSALRDEDIQRVVGVVRSVAGST